MGMRSYLDAPMLCPRCHRQSETEIELFFGSLSMDRHRFGDKFPWPDALPASDGGRPENGTCVGEGYAVCPLCSKDYHLRVHVKNDILVSAEPDLLRPPYIA